MRKLLSGIVVLCLQALISAAQGALVDVLTDPELIAKCHQHSVLHCNISTSGNLNVSAMSWIREDNKKTLCHVNRNGDLHHDKDSHGISCTYNPGKQLTLTIKHTEHVHEGVYSCKLTSNKGMKSNRTAVKLPACYRYAEPLLHPSEVECSFYGVHPEGVVHWLDNNRNLTRTSTSNSTGPNLHGRYNVSSTFSNTEDTQGLKCSLWIPSLGIYLKSLEIPAQARMQSSAPTLHAAGLGLGLLLIVHLRV